MTDTERRKVALMLVVFTGDRLGPLDPALDFEFTSAIVHELITIVAVNDQPQGEMRARAALLACRLMDDCQMDVVPPKPIA